jgi:lipopolysaccharide/colanic/teichoic acid biosynthesis glycosyltransferase
MVRWSKRLVDVVAASVGLVVLSPLLVVVAIAVVVLDGRPVLFTQRRSGLNGEPFELHKFRSMSTGSDDPTTDAQRITRLGAVLRSTSLDELPTLWDVARGAMSLVGPRPLPERYLDRYTPEQRRRLEVRPGVTGLAQVRGRNPRAGPSSSSRRCHSSRCSPASDRERRPADESPPSRRCRSARIPVRRSTSRTRDRPTRR